MRSPYWRWACRGILVTRVSGSPGQLHRGALNQPGNRVLAHVGGSTICHPNLKTPSNSHKVRILLIYSVRSFSPVKIYPKDHRLIVSARATQRSAP
jgi:hypothetical protein